MYSKNEYFSLNHEHLIEIKYFKRIVTQILGTSEKIIPNVFTKPRLRLSYETKKLSMSVK